MYWIRGVIYVVSILVAWYFLKPVIPQIMELTGNTSAILTFTLFIVFGPLVAGWLGEKLLHPLLRRSQRVEGVALWEDRLVKELAPDDDRGYTVVIVPWPSDKVQSLGLLTETYASGDNDTPFASVYIPGTPDPTRGALRMVHVDDLVKTEWTMADLLNYHLTFGGAGPQLKEVDEKLQQ